MDMKLNYRYLPYVFDEIRTAVDPVGTTPGNGVEDL